jgi:hypothetical protein
MREKHQLVQLLALVQLLNPKCKTYWRADLKGSTAKLFIKERKKVYAARDFPNKYVSLFSNIQ